MQRSLCLQKGAERKRGIRRGYVPPSRSRSRDPTNHYVASWPAGEQLTPAQVDEAIDIFRQELDIPDLLMAYALHADTENWHAHIVILRVDPDTGKSVQTQKGFDLEAAQRAGPLIENKQGWRVTANKRWLVVDGRIGPADPNPQNPTGRGPRSPTSAASRRSAAAMWSTGPESRP